MDASAEEKGKELAIIDDAHHGGEVSDTTTIIDAPQRDKISVRSEGRTIIAVQSTVTLGSGGTGCHTQGITQKSLDAVKARYIRLCESHEVHHVDKGVIKTRMFSINEFSVMLKLITNATCNGTFSDERDKHFEELGRSTACFLNISNVIDGSTRVTFLRGIPGIGKSVLAKQMAFGWASGTMFENFGKCIYFECRKLNAYKFDEGKHNGNEQLLADFLKKTLCGSDFEDGEDVLIIIDGVDELFDFREKNSIIFQFLDRSNICPKSKIVVTGRPHAEELLTRPRMDIGIFKIFEIGGLLESDKRKYIQWFSSIVDKEHASMYRQFINQTIDGSDSIRFLTSVPQFLNTICCVSVLTKGRKVQSETELYSWTLFLLLKQHIFEREDVSEDSFISIIFRKYIQSIEVLSEISFDLYSSNQIIFKRDDYKALFDSISDGASDIEKSFIHGLFVDISDNFQKRLQFKHLSLMEFFAAVHVCRLKDPTESIKKLLRSRMFEVVRYLCGLYGGAFQESTNIIKCLLVCIKEPEVERRNSFNFDKRLKEFAHSFLENVVNIVWKNEVHLNDLLQHAIDFIVQFLSQNFVDVEVFKTLLNRQWPFWAHNSAKDETNLIALMNHLAAAATEVKSSFAIFLDAHTVYNIEVFNVFKHIFHVFRIAMRDMNIDGHSLSVIVQNLIYCNTLQIENCVFEDHFVDIDLPQSLESRKGVLAIRRCTLTANSFKTVVKWVKLREWFILSEIEVTKRLLEIYCDTIDNSEDRRSVTDVLTLDRIKFDEDSWVNAVKLIAVQKEVMLINCVIDWWGKLADEIEERKSRQKLQLHTLVILEDNLLIHESIRKKIEGCGIRLYINRPQPGERHVLRLCFLAEKPPGFDRAIPVHLSELNEEEQIAMAMQLSMQDRKMNNTDARRPSVAASNCIERSILSRDIKQGSLPVDPSAMSEEQQIEMAIQLSTRSSRIMDANSRRLPTAEPDNMQNSPLEKHSEQGSLPADASALSEEQQIAMAIQLSMQCSEMKKTNFGRQTTAETSNVQSSTLANKFDQGFLHVDLSSMSEEEQIAMAVQLSTQISETKEGDSRRPTLTATDDILNSSMAKFSEQLCATSRPGSSSASGSSIGSLHSLPSEVQICTGRKCSSIVIPGAEEKTDYFPKV